MIVYRCISEREIANMIGIPITVDPINHIVRINIKLYRIII